MRKIATQNNSKKISQNFTRTMSNKVLTPSNADVETVRDFANYNSKSSAYNAADVSVVLNILYAQYISKDLRVCWDSTEKMYVAVWNNGQPVVDKVKSWLRTKDGDVKYAQSLIRTVIWNFLAALEAGKITSYGKPQCLEQGSKEVAGKGAGTPNTDVSKTLPTPLPSIFSDFVQNPVAIAIATVVVVGGGIAVWQYKKNN
jgi:hypothetical protein